MSGKISVWDSGAGKFVELTEANAAELLLTEQLVAGEVFIDLRDPTTVHAVAEPSDCATPTVVEARPQ